MNAHLQRLLARVAPASPGLALGVQPVNAVDSPLAESDQRIGLPEFSGIAVPAEIDLFPAALEGTQLPAPEETSKTPRVSPPRGPSLPDRPVPATPQPTPVTISEHASPAVQAPAPPAEAPSPPVARPEQPSAVSPRIGPEAAPAWRPPFEIETNDFEPYPAAPPERAPGSEDERRSQAEPAPQERAEEAVPLPAPEPAEPLAAEAHPIRPRVALVSSETVAPPEAAPAQDSRRIAAGLPIPAGVEVEAPEPSRAVVIEEVVIDIVPPALERPAAAPMQADGRAGSRAMPLSAEAASVIGPLPMSRRQPTILGMRRR